MKRLMKFIYIIFVLVILLNACKRNEPGSDVVAPPGVTTLQPLKVIDLNSILTEPSGIFYNSKNNSLLVVSDARPDIFELDLNGNLLNKISVSGVDMEGVTMTKNCDTILVVEETARLVSSFLYNGNKISSMLVDVATNPSHCLEGITIDDNYHLFVINERDPMLMLEFANGTEINRKQLSYSTDVSDICYDKETNCFWVISDESKKIFKINRNGNLVGEWLITFDKGEGITFVQDKMYIVRDTDSKMYIYNKPQ